MVGLPLLLGSDHPPLEAMTQDGGTVLRLDTATFLEVLEAQPGLRAVLLRCADAFSAQLS